MELSHKLRTPILILLLGSGLVLQGMAAQVEGAFDRLVAVVNREVVTFSDLQWLVKFRGFRVPESPEEQLALFQQALDQLINQRLITGETSRTPFISVADEELENFLGTYKTRFSSEAEYRETLEQMSMEETDLLRILEAQIAVNKFVQLRFEPFVIVLPDEIEEFYETEYVPELKEANQIVPPLEVIEETIRQILIVRKTNQQLERWIQNARNNASIQTLLERNPVDSPNIPEEFLSGFSFGYWRFEEGATAGR